jgi:hypothetical protein
VGSGSVIIRPNADIAFAPSGTTGVWTPIPAGAHWSTIDDAVIFPATPSTADVITAAANGRYDRVGFTAHGLSPNPARRWKSYTLWLYARRTSAVPNTSTLILEAFCPGSAPVVPGVSRGVGVGGKVFSGVDALPTSFAWVSMQFTGFTKSDADVDDFECSFRYSQTPGSIVIAAAYAEWLYEEGPSAMVTNRGKKLLMDWGFRNATEPANFFLALVTSAVAPTPDTNVFSELTEIAAGNGYVSGGQSVARNSTDFDVLTEDDTNDLAQLQLKDFDWTASGGSIPASGAGARYAVLLTDEGTVGNRQVVAAWDLQSDRTASNGQVLRLQNTEIRAEEAA